MCVLDRRACWVTPLRQKVQQHFLAVQPPGGVGIASEATTTLPNLFVFTIALLFIEQMETQMLTGQPFLCHLLAAQLLSELAMCGNIGSLSCSGSADCVCAFNSLCRTRVYDRNGMAWDSAPCLVTASPVSLGLVCSLYPNGHLPLACEKAVDMRNSLLQW